MVETLKIVDLTASSNAVAGGLPGGSSYSCGTELRVVGRLAFIRESWADWVKLGVTVMMNKKTEDGRGKREDIDGDGNRNGEFKGEGVGAVCTFF